MYRHNQSTPARGQQEPKAPKPPERPLVPFMRYSRKMWHKIRAENPDRPLWDIGKLVGQMWRELPEGERAAYQQEYEAEKGDYEKAMKAYQNSPAYQQFLTAKSRSSKSVSSAPLLQQSVQPTMASSVGRRAVNAGVDNSVGMIIQPVDDEDPYEMTAKKLAAMRYERNNRLMTELFSPLYLPDTRNVVHQQRIDQLRKQAQNLTDHQNKLNEELSRLEEQFNERKRRLESASEEFSKKLKVVVEEQPQMDGERYAAMVAEWVEAIKRSYDEFLEKNAQYRTEEGTAEAKSYSGDTSTMDGASVANVEPTKPDMATNDSSAPATAGDVKMEGEAMGTAS